ncbi:hypothetical protein PMAYCL1PPCAC_17390, partial [Pristionchus mayeri]
ITAPIWLALITNVLAIVVIVFLLEDEKEDETEELLPEPPPPISFSSIREKLNQLRALKLPWILIVLVIFEKIISGLFYSTYSGIGGPMMSTMYALTGQQIILLSAISQV